MLPCGKRSRSSLSAVSVSEQSRLVLRTAGRPAADGHHGEFHVDVVAVNAQQLLPSALSTGDRLLLLLMNRLANGEDRGAAYANCFFNTAAFNHLDRLHMEAAASHDNIYIVASLYYEYHISSSSSSSFSFSPCSSHHRYH